MSLQSELTRLQANATSISSSKDDIMTALASKGVTVPSGATLHDVPFLISSIDGRAPDPDPEDSVLIGGRWYHYVRIGNQLWLDENLDYKFDVDGSTIPIGSSGSPSTPAAWYYSNDEATYGIDGTYKCGLLYNHYAVEYLDQNKAALLPDGWRIPSKSDFETLISTVDGSAIKLKAAPDSITTNWPPSSWNGTDDYGFTALPHGDYTNGFYNLNSYGNYWSTTFDFNDYYFNICCSYDSNAVMIGESHRYSGFGIRLVKSLQGAT